MTLGETLMIEINHISRTELYDLVWSIPMIKLAERFGLSDNGLKKKCEKHKIPRPKMGHWTKIECGHNIEKTPLPIIDDPSLEIIEFYEKPIKQASHRNNELREEQSPAILKALKFKFPKRVAKYHPLIKKYRENAKEKYYDRYGHVSFGHEKQGINVRVTAGSVDRISRFLQALIILFESIGWKLSSFQSRHYHKECHAFSCNGMDIHIKIKERVKQSPHIKTEKEKKDKYFYGPTYDYHPTGVIELSIENTYGSGFTTKWKDNKKLKLEDQLASIVQGMERTFSHKKQQSIDAEIAHKKREIEKEKEREVQRLQDIEKKRRELLFSLVEKQKDAAALRELISIFEESNYPENFTGWLDWAKSVADEVDPIKNPEAILAEHNRIAEKPSWSW